MLWYTIKRIILVPIMLLLVGLIIYFFLSLSPTDPIAQMLPSEYTMEQYEALKTEMGLDKPVIIQYVNWVINAFKGDLGISYKTRAPVWQDVGFRIPTSVKFSLITTLVVIIIGLPLGVMCAVKQYSIFDQTTNVISKIMGAIPGFWLGLMLILLFAQKLKWFPTFGIGSWKHWILPVITQFLPFCANYLRQARSAMLDCIRQDYVRTARSKGNKEGTVIFRDALRNALLPMITLSGGSFAVMIGGAVVVENVFAIPGIGSKLVESINSKDIPVVLFCAIILAAIFSIMNLIIDLAYALVDPRVKSTFIKRKKVKKIESVKEVA